MRTNQRNTILVPLLALLVTATTISVGDAQGNPSAKEAELLAIINSDAPAAEKAVTCKLLAIHGSSAAVADVAKLLSDPQLSSWARIALEAIPGDESDEALRKAAGSLDGELLVGTINSIGVRRDAKAVELLTTRLQDDDAQVASAAAVALGRIANADATKSLRGALATAPAKVRSAVAEGCVLCAERLHAAGDSAAAVEVYDQIRAADVPKQRVIEATRGAILARKQEGIPLLIEQLQSPDKQQFYLGLSTAREFPGGEVDKALAEELQRAAPGRAALIVVAMADRPETVSVAAIAKAATDGPTQVRLAAIGALGRLGDGSSLTTLLDASLEADEALSAAAKTALASLSGEKVDEQIVALLPKAKGESYPLLIELVGQRRIDAVSELVKALNHKDQAVRHVALKSLGETVALDRLPLLVSQVITPKAPRDYEVARRALLAASVRMPDREACAAALSTAMDQAPKTAKSTLLEVIGAVGGTKALQTLAAASKSSDPQLQDTGSRLLGRWNSVDAAPVLLDLAKTAPQNKYQIRALRGYIGLARKFAMPEPNRVAMCEKAFATAQRTAEQQLVLDVLKLKPSAGGLKLAATAMEIPELKEAATQTVLVIAQKVGGKNADVSELLSKAGLEVKLEIIKAEYGAGSTQKDVTAVVRKHASDLPLIALPKASYNANFGGDPLPGTVKKLKIQYRINGKRGEATFAENALIVLAIPE